MSELEREHDIEILRKQALLLERQVTVVMQQNAQLLKDSHELKGGGPRQLELRLGELNRQLEALKRKTFGESSERRPRDKEPGGAAAARGHGPRTQADLPHRRRSCRPARATRRSLRSKWRWASTPTTYRWSGR